jgi:outer membrane protein assembly factor BamB
MTRAVTAFVLILIATGPVHADWPTPLGNNQRTGITGEALAFPLSEQWHYTPSCPPAKGFPPPRAGYNSFKLSSNVNYDEASPVTVLKGTAVFAASGEQCVVAVDVASGKAKWTFPVGAPPRLAPTLHNDTAVFGTDEGIVYCLDLITGKERWRFNAAPAGDMVMGQGRLISMWPVRSAVVVDGDTAFVTAGMFSAEGVYLIALDPTTGKLKWRRRLQSRNNDGVSPQGYPLVDDKSIFLTSRVRPARFSKVDGSALDFDVPLPKVKDAAYRFYDGGSYAQLWHGKLVYGQGAIIAADPNASYKDKYNRERFGTLQFTWFNGRRIIFNDDIAFIGMDDCVLAVDTAAAPDISKKELLAFEDTHRSNRVPVSSETLRRVDEFGGPESERGKAILESRVKYALKEYAKWPDNSAKLLANIEKRCKWMTRVRTVNEAMIMAGKHLIAAGEKELVAIDSTNGNIVWRVPTDSRIRTLAVSDGRLFVSSVDGKVRCFGKNNARPAVVVRDTAVETFKRGQTAWPTGLPMLGLPTQGHALVIGPHASEAAEVLARDTALHITALAGDKTNAQRWIHHCLNLYGSKVSMPGQHVGVSDIPPYLFNVVVDTAAKGTPGISRLVRPHGGMLLSVKKPNGLEAPEWSETTTDTGSAMTRGKQAGTANWTHNYATPGNTYCSEDQLADGPFGILWFGEPGPQDRVDRHSRAPMPLVLDGITIMTGYDKIMGYDAFNGTKYWQRWLPGVTRSNLPFGTSNLAASKAGVFAVVNDRECHVIDIKTGQTARKIAAPVGDDPKKAFWGWIAADDHRVYGSSSGYDERRRQPLADRGHAVFAFDAATGKPAWTYQGAGIEHDGIALEGGRLYLLDAKLSDAEKQQAAGSAPKGTAPARKLVDRRGNKLEADLRKIVALDAASGKIIWQKPYDLTAVTLDDRAMGSSSVRGSGAFCMVSKGVLVVCGIGSIGHPYKEFTKGEFARRSIYTFDAATGKLLWGGERNYRKRPIIVGDYIYAEPSAWHLKTGKVKTEVDPVTGKERPIDYLRGYSGCDHLVASGKALFGNASTGGMAHLPLGGSEGYTPLSSLMFACGTGAVPANGIFVAPEGRSGCTCATQVHASLALYPRTTGRAWGFDPRGAAKVEAVTVENLAINLGAPGRMRGSDGTLWLGYRGGGVSGGRYSDIFPRYKHSESDFVSESSDLFTIEGTTDPWLYTGAMHSKKKLSFRLVGEGQKPATYSVRLHFAEFANVKPGERVFDIKLQGKTVMGDVDIAAAGISTVVIREFKGIAVTRDLEIELVPKGKLPPSLAAFAVERE